MEHTPLTPTIVGGMDFDQPSKNAKKKCYNCGGKGYTTQAYAFRRVEKHICLYCQITCYKCGAIKGTKKCKYKKHVWQKLLPVPRVIPNKMK